MSKTKQINIDENIIDVALDEVMHDSFMTYAEYVAMERALPRVEDGLKPVQRRILYTLNELGITPDKPYKKSARVVGETLGKYHPHGDTSVYEAMVRLAQEHVMRMPLVDGHGNFGSMDGDSAAAMRYTEVRMSPLALEMLRDLNKDTVPFRPNFDDTEQEPDVLPARYPNLLVNGTSGIAVAMGTSIPPHNLGEVISGVLHRIDHPDCSLKSIMKYIKGPDFPTGGYILAGDDLIKGYETGKGKVYVRAKTHFEKLKNGKTNIVITEIPYDVKKSALLEQILAVSESKKDLFNSIDDIRDESDREGIRAVIEIKKGTDAEKILHLLYKYTNMQITFRIDMMAIADDRPKLLSLTDILDKYIEHQKNVIIRRTRYDLEKAEKREHILLGLIIAVENIDRVIAIIRGAKNLGEAKKGLMKEFQLTGVQAQAILDMRLARLNKLEVTSLQNEYKEVTAQIQYFKSILNSDEKLLKVIKQELTAIKKKYSDDRRTQILDEEEAVINIDESQFVRSEECVVVLTNSGNIKRMSAKVFQKGAESANTEVKNLPAQLIKTDTAQKLCIFMTNGNMYTIPVSQIPEGKLKDAGKPLTAVLSGVDNFEKIVKVFTQKQIEQQPGVIFFTKSGMIKAAEANDFIVKKTRIMACGLKDDDSVINIELNDGSTNEFIIITKEGMSIKFLKDDVPVMGRAAKGVSAIKLDGEDCVILGSQRYEGDYKVIMISDLGYVKKVPLNDFEIQGRNGKGVKAFKFTRETGGFLTAAFILKDDLKISAVQKSGEITDFNTANVPTESKSGSGKQTVLCVMGDYIENVYINSLDK